MQRNLSVVQSRLSVFLQANGKKAVAKERVAKRRGHPRQSPHRWLDRSIKAKRGHQQRNRKQIGRKRQQRKRSTTTTKTTMRKKMSSEVE